MRRRRRTPRCGTEARDRLAPGPPSPVGWRGRAGRSGRARGRAQVGDVELPHPHAGLHDLGGGRRVGGPAGELLGDALPREAELVLQPAAGPFLAAVAYEAVPVAVDLGL